jgi:hypothetical protein
MKNFRDIENLSAYLDGQLNASDAAQLESRLKTDTELASTLSDLRAARGILRKLPARKAPRNFTLTRQMVGLKPPLPRTYPLFRLATAFAAILFLFSFAANTLAPMSSGAASPIYGIGGACEYGCGGGGGADPSMESSAAATEAPAAAPESSLAQEAPTMTADPAADMAPFAVTEDSARIVETPSAKAAPSETAPQPASTNEAPASFNWTWLFLALSVIGVVVLWVMRVSASRKWR